MKGTGYEKPGIKHFSDTHWDCCKALTLSGCQQTEQTAAQNETVVFQLTPSTAGVGEFLRQFKGYETTYDQDICYNITPKDITDRYDFLHI